MSPAVCVCVRARCGRGGGWWGAAASPSFPSPTLAGVEGEGSLWGAGVLCTHHDGDAIADGGDLVRVCIPPLPFVCRDILLAMLI